MQRLKKYENHPVCLTYRNNGYANTVHGVVTTVGKDYVLFLEWHGKKEIPVRKTKITEIKMIKR